MDALIMVLLPWLERIFTESNPARLAESLVILFVAYWRVKGLFTAHLTKIEQSLDQMSAAIEKGFAAGEARFTNIEKRVEKLETK